MVLVATYGDKDDANDGPGVDFRGNTVDKSKTGGWLAAGLILGMELAERICLQGISMNLVTYLVGDLHISSAKSATIVTNLLGTLNLLGLLGGFVADAKLGRYKTIAIAGTITTVGVILLTVAVSIPSMKPPPCDGDSYQQQPCIEANGRQLAMLYVALYTVALGVAGITPNVSGFGSDQFDDEDPKEQKALFFFFNRFYFAITTGSLFAVTVSVYIQDNVGRGWGYGISAGIMIIAVAVLLFGTRFYRYKKPRGSPLTVIWRVIFLAWKKRAHPYPSDPNLLNEYQSSKVPHTEKFKCLDKAAILDDHAAATGGKDNPWIVSTVTQVEEVKMVLKLIPIWSTCIIFWTICSQMTTFTVEQASLMHRKIGSFVIPAGSFSAFIIITILLFTSLNEKLFVPLARKLTHKVQGITSLQRIGIGLIFSTATMIAAAIVEKERRAAAVRESMQLSAFWLVPQYFFVGAGQAFVYVGQLEFFIREAPERMKSMSTGFLLSTLSLGFFLSSVLVSIVDDVTKNRWLTSNFNRGKLNYFYWLLAVLGVLNFLVFLTFAMRHQYKAHKHSSTNENGEKELKTSNAATVAKMEEETIIQAMEGA